MVNRAEGQLFISLVIELRQEMFDNATHSRKS
jgi:hypothetical protein